MESGDQPDLMFGIRPARPGDASDIARIHVATWRSAYAGLLPDHVLTGLSTSRLAAHYDQLIRRRRIVLVAEPDDATAPVAFATAGRARAGGLASGEIETLYVLDDWRERGIGRHLLKRAARGLAAPPFDCQSFFLWVLSDNPSRWFYERLGGRPVTYGTTTVGGRSFAQTALVWDDPTAM